METIDQSKNKKWKAHTGWLDGVWYDSIFIFGVFSIAITSGVILLLEPSLFYPVLTIDIILLGYHHVIATFTKLGVTKEDRKENYFLIYILPFLVLAGVGVLTYFFGIWIIVTIYFFWQWYHYTRQSYGIGVFYRRKSKQLPQKKTMINFLAIWSIPILGLLYRCSQGWEEFLFNPLYLPSIPEWLLFFVGLVAIISIFCWVGSKISEYRQGILSIAQTSFIASHMLIFYVGYVAIEDINTGWLVANVWHNAQYIMFVWLFNVNRFGKPEKTDGFSYLQSLVTRKPTKILTYFCLTLAVSILFYSILGIGFRAVSSSTGILLANIYIIGFQTVNFHHYIVDSIIWKARDKKNQKSMKIE